MNTFALLAKRKPNERHWYAYDVLVDGEAIVSDSRDPEHDLPRALLRRGIVGVVEIIDGRTGKPRSRTDVEVASKRGVGSNLDRYRCKPREIGKDTPPAGETNPLRIQGWEAA
jgi:hypothetical protein